MKRGEKMRGERKGDGAECLLLHILSSGDPQAKRTRAFDVSASLKEIMSRGRECIGISKLN